MKLMTRNPAEAQEDVLPGLYLHSSLTKMEKVALNDFLEIFKAVGAERGINSTADLITQTADGADLNAMWAEYMRLLALHNQDRQPLLTLLTYQVTRLVEKVMYPVESDFEKASEFGVPKSIRPGKPFTMGYNWDLWDIAIRYTWRYLAESTRAEIDALTNSALDADKRLQFVKILARLFNPVQDETEVNDLPITVYPLYNGDAMVPPKYKTTTHTAPHTHYLASGAGTIDPGDINDIQTHLEHHGYTMTRGYRMALIVNKQEGDVIRGFKVGVNGSKYDFIPSANSGWGGIVLPPGTVIGAPPANVPGLITIGTYGPFAVAVEDYMPAGYVLGFVSGGQDDIGNLIGIREHENPALRGLRLLRGSQHDYPLVDSYYLRGFGTGVRHRGAGVVMKITAGAYSVPAEYTT